MAEGSLNRARAAAAPHAGAGHGLPPQARSQQRGLTLAHGPYTGQGGRPGRGTEMQNDAGPGGGAECGGTWGPRGPMAGSGDHVGPRGSQDRREHWRLLEPGRVRGRRGHRSTATPSTLPAAPQPRRPARRPGPHAHPPGWSSRRKLHSRSEKLELKPGGLWRGRGSPRAREPRRGQGRVRLCLHGTHEPALKPTRMKRNPHTEG